MGGGGHMGGYIPSCGSHQRHCSRRGPQRESRVGTLLHFFGSDNYATSSSNLQALLAVRVIHRRGFVLTCGCASLAVWKGLEPNEHGSPLFWARKERSFASCAGLGEAKAKPISMLRWYPLPTVMPNSSHFVPPQSLSAQGRLNVDETHQGLEKAWEGL